MADNTTLAAGSGGDTLATDDIGGVKYPRSKIVIGADGTNDGDVSATNPLPVKGTGTAGTANAGVVTVQGIAAMTAVQVADNSGSLTVDAPVATPVFVRLSDGSAAIATLPVSLASVPSHAVTNEGTFVTQIDGAALNALQLIDNLVLAEDAVHANGEPGIQLLAVRNDADSSLCGTSGDYTPLQLDSSGFLKVNIKAGDGLGVAHDGADSGNPNKIGAKATTSLAGLTLVSNADRTDLFAGVDGVLLTRPHCNLEDIVTATPVAITDGSSTSVISAQGAGIKVYIVEVIIANSSASNVTVDLRDGTAGAVKATFPVPANGGVVKTLATPLPFSANTAVAADPSAAASTITVTLIGFKSKV